MKIMSLIVSGMLVCFLGGCNSGQAQNKSAQMNNQKCPVSGKSVNSEDTYTHKGKEYKLCSKKCKHTLDKNPDKYLNE